MPKKNTTKKENENVDLEKTQKLDVDAIKKPDMESKNTKESQKKNSKTTTKNNKTTSKKTSSKKKNNELPKFEKEDVTITEVVSKINEEKGHIKNPEITNKKSGMSSIILLLLVIVVIWAMIYYLFLSPNAYLKNNDKENTLENEVTDDAQTENDEVNEELLMIAETSAQNFVSAAMLWHQDALMRYGSLTDVEVLKDGSVVKLDEQDSFALNNDEKINVSGSLPDSINSMIISKDGIIVISQINFNGYCFDYNGESLTNVEC